MRNSTNSGLSGSLARYGFLFADLFAVLAMIFLLANTVGSFPKPKVVPTPTPTPIPTATATPAPVICGLDNTAAYDNNNTNQAFQVQFALANNDSGAIAAFKQEVQSALQPYKTRGAGFVLVWGGGTVGQGTSLADGAIVGLKQLGAQGFIFTKTSYRPLWNGNLNSDTVGLTIFFYRLSVGGHSCTLG